MDTPQTSFTVQEAAELLKRDRNTIYKWCKNGTLPGVWRAGQRELRIPLAAVDAIRYGQPQPVKVDVGI